MKVVSRTYLECKDATHNKFYEILITEDQTAPNGKPFEVIGCYGPIPVGGMNKRACGEGTRHTKGSFDSLHQATIKTLDIIKGKTSKSYVTADQKVLQFGEDGKTKVRRKHVEQDDGSEDMLLNRFSEIIKS